MAENPRQLPRTLWLGFSLLTGLMALAYLVSLAQLQRAHPGALPVLGSIADFTLTNQVWVGDIIFTRCAGPCPRLTRQMQSLQELLPASSTAKLVTLTTDPDFDTPAVLQKYGERFQADPRRWFFLTGTKQEVAALAAGSLKLSAQAVKADDQKNAADLFIHTTIFVVVDKHARLRAVFETGGEGVEWSAVQPRLLETIHQLEREP